MFAGEISFSGAALFIVSACLTIVCITRIYTFIAYRITVSGSGRTAKDGVLTSPLLPYSIPWFGHTLRFFEKHADRWYHRQKLQPPHGVYTLLIAGRKTHIVNNAAATRHLFRHSYTGRLSRENFVGDLLGKCLLVTPHDISIINKGEGRKRQEELLLKYLGRRESVRELTLAFSDVLSRSYVSSLSQHDGSQDIRLYTWLRKQLIRTSSTVFFGEQLLQVYPEICDEIFYFDEDLCSFFFDVPRVLNRAAWDRRDRILNNLVKWDALMYELNKGPPDRDEDSTSWDPVFGSRFNKARLRYYDQFDLCPISRAGMHLSIMFALASNVVPAIGWMLMHILAGTESQRLLASVKKEVHAATKADGTLDVSLLLASSPLLQSIWTEVTRHYCDNMIMRDVVGDTMIPLDDQGVTRLKVQKDDLIISPCWVAHHDPKTWQTEAYEPSPQGFVADRFLGQNLSHAKVSALAGVPTPQMYPFGGGKSICAGRMFAKEEALVAVAQTLKSFDFEVKGFVDGKGRPTSDFPGLTPSLPGVTIYVPLGDSLVSISRARAKESRL